MSASLVGSEMCIRDRPRSFRQRASGVSATASARNRQKTVPSSAAQPTNCLLYTSDAADDM
eukprot:8293349-Alexandrium_andersonii.AAC.1